MNGPQWLLGELVGGANPPDAMRRLPMQKAALEARAAVVTDVRIRKAEVDSLNERVAADLAEADLVHKRQDDERRQVQRLVEQLQQTLDKIDEQLAGYLEAEQARAEAARRAAWSGYMSGVGTVQSWLQAGPVARAAVRWALAQLGDPYRWGGDRARQVRLLGADQLGLPGGRGQHPAGVAGPVGRRPARRRGQPAPRRPRLLRRQPQRPGHHPPRRHVHRQRPDGACPPHRRRGPGRLHLA